MNCNARTLLRLMSALLCGALVAGTAGPHVAAQMSSQPIRIILATGGAGRAFGAMIKDFEASSGIKTEVAQYPYDTAKEKELLELSGKSGNLDIVLMDDSWFAQFNQFLEPLTPLIARDKYDTAAFIPAFLDLFSSQGRGVYAFPVRVGGWVLYYRADLMTQHNIQVPFRTWDDFLNATQTLTQGPTYGFAASLQQGDYLVSQWEPILWSFGADFLDRQNRRAAFNTSRGREATQFLVDLYRKYKTIPPGAIQWDNDGVITAMQQGIAATALTYSPYLTEMSNPSKSRFGAYIRVAGRLPTSRDSGLKEGVSLVAGWGMGIANSSRNKEGAWRFLKFVGSPQEQRLAAMNSSNAPTVSAVFKDPEYIRVYPEAAPVLATMLHAKSAPHILRWTNVEDAVAAQLSAALAGTKSVAQALAEAERAVNQLLR